MLNIYSRGRKGLNLTGNVYQNSIPVLHHCFFLIHPVIPWLSDSLPPFMSSGCGEAAYPWFGSFVSFYAGLGAVVPLGLGPKELTIVAAMLLLAHDLPIEAAVSKKSGSRIFSLILMRVLLACAFGIGINYIF